MPLIDFPREECRCFFKKLLSFPNSAFSRWRRRSSSIISSWDFSSSLFWHSSRYERTQLETVALDRPYSTTRLQSCVHPECAHEQLFVWFRLIFESCAFLLCWRYNLSGRGVTNSLYHCTGCLCPEKVACREHRPAKKSARYRSKSTTMIYAR